MSRRLLNEDISVRDLEGMVYECSSYDGSLEEYY